MNVANVRVQFLLRVLIFVTPLALMMSGQARAEVVPTPSGSYSITLGDGVEVNTTFRCDSAECVIGGFGSSITISRTDNFSEVTRGWLPSNRVLLGGGPISVTGRYYPLSDPEYPQKTRTWIPSAIGSISTRAFFNTAKQRYESRGAVLGPSQDSEDSHTALLIINWLEPRMNFNLSWNSNDPRVNCSARFGCDNIPFGGISLAAPVAVVTTTSAPTTTTTTTTVAPTTTVIEEQIDTQATTSSTVDLELTTSENAGESSPVVTALDADTSASKSDQVVASALRDVTETPSGATSTVLLTVASVASIAAVGAASAGAAAASAASSASAASGSRVAGPGGIGGGTGGNTAGGTGRSFGVDEMPETHRPEGQSDGQSVKTTETTAAMFTAEQLSYQERVIASGVAVPAVLQHSRIALRVFYDVSLASAVSATVFRDSKRHSVPYLGSPLVIASLAGVAAGSLGLSMLANADSSVGLAVFVASGFAAGLISAVHGTVFAVVAAVLGIAGISNVFESSRAAGGSSTASPLTLSLLVVLCCFLPLLATTVTRSNALGEWTRRQSLQLLGGFIAMFIISVKISQELTSQMSSSGVGFVSPRVLLPALVGAVIPLWRMLVEAWLRRVGRQSTSTTRTSLLPDDDAWRGEVARIVQLTAELRRGELLRPPNFRTRSIGTAICVLILGFIAYSYLQHVAAVALICLSYVLISLLHFPQSRHPERKWGELLIRGRVSWMRPIPYWATLLGPTVGAMVLGLVVAALRIDANTAIWISVVFSYAILLFELYDMSAAEPEVALA